MSAQLGDFLDIEPREPTRRELFEQLNYEYDRIHNALQPGNEGLLESIGDAFASITGVFKKIAMKILPDILLLVRNAEIQANFVASKSKGIDKFYTPNGFNKFSKTLFPIIPGFSGGLLAAHTAVYNSTRVIQANLLQHLKDINKELTRIATSPDADKAIVTAMGSEKNVQETIKAIGTPHEDFMSNKTHFDRMVGSKLYGNFREIEDAGKIVGSTGVIFTPRDSKKVEKLIRELDDISAEVIRRIETGSVTVSKKAIKDLAKIIKATADLLEVVAKVTYFNTAITGTSKEVIVWIRKNLK